MLETVYKIERKNETGSDTDHMKSASGQRPDIIHNIICIICYLQCVNCINVVSIIYFVISLVLDCTTTMVVVLVVLVVQSKTKDITK